MERKGSERKREGERRGEKGSKGEKTERGGGSWRNGKGKERGQGEDCFRSLLCINKCLQESFPIGMYFLQCQRNQGAAQCTRVVVCSQFSSDIIALHITLPVWLPSSWNVA